MKRMWQPNTLLPSILLALVLSTGVLLVWGLVYGIARQVVSSFQAPQPSTSLVFTVDGEPLIQTSLDGTQTLRTLNGEQIADPRSVELRSDYPHDLLAASASERFLQGWNWRIAGFLPASFDPVFWYLILDGQDQDSVYFAGYEPSTNRMIGYLGRSGYQTSVPQGEQRIPFHRNKMMNGGWTPTVGSFGTQPRRRHEWQTLYLASDGRLLAVNLNEQSVAEVPLEEPVVSVGQFQQIRPVEDEREYVYDDRIVIRLADELLIWDLDGKPLAKLPLPEALRDQNLQLRGEDGGGIIVEAHPPDVYYAPRELYWFNDGQVTRQEVASVYQQRSSKDPTAAWIVCSSLPVPALLLLIAVANSATAVKSGEAPDFVTAFAETATLFGPPFLVLLAISLVGVWYVRRRQRTFAASGTIVWMLFVALFGPAALLGYLLHRPWPARAACEECGRVVPRDRSVCPACERAFPAPARRGIEVFA